LTELYAPLSFVAQIRDLSFDYYCVLSTCKSLELTGEIRINFMHTYLQKDD